MSVMRFNASNVSALWCSRCRVELESRLRLRDAAVAVMNSMAFVLRMTMAAAVVNRAGTYMAPPIALPTAAVSQTRIAAVRPWISCGGDRADREGGGSKSRVGVLTDTAPELGGPRRTRRELLVASTNTPPFQKTSSCPSRWSHRLVMPRTHRGRAVRAS